MMALKETQDTPAKRKMLETVRKTHPAQVHIYAKQRALVEGETIADGHTAVAIHIETQGIAGTIEQRQLGTVELLKLAIIEVEKE